MFNHTVLPNFHVIIVKYIGQSNYLPARVKIISERFKEHVTFSYNSEGGQTLDQAEEWLTERGHKVIGHGEGKGHYYVICDHVNGLFSPLKPKKPDYSEYPTKTPLTGKALKMQKHIKKFGYGV